MQLAHNQSAMKNIWKEVRCDYMCVVCRHLPICQEPFFFRESPFLTLSPPRSTHPFPWFPMTTHFLYHAHIILTLRVVWCVYVPPLATQQQILSIRLTLNHFYIISSISIRKTCNYSLSLYILTFLSCISHLNMSWNLYNVS